MRAGKFADPLAGSADEFGANWSDEVRCADRLDAKCEDSERTNVKPFVRVGGLAAGESKGTEVVVKLKNRLSSSLALDVSVEAFQWPVSSLSVERTNSLGFIR